MPNNHLASPAAPGADRRTGPCERRRPGRPERRALSPRCVAACLREVEGRVSGRFGRHRAEEAAATAVAKALQEFGAAPVSVHALALWLYRVARNEALLQIRSAQSRERSERRAARTDGVDCDPAHGLIRAEAAGMVGAALAALAPDERAIIEECLVDGLSYRRAAAKLGLTPGRARRRLARAKRNVRAALEARGFRAGD